MEMKHFNLKWAHGTRQGKPVYISSNKILIPSDFFMKTCDITGSNLRYHFEPKTKIGCCCSLPELGIVAVSERKANGAAIHILSYPKMCKLSILRKYNNAPYSALSFVGLEFLISIQTKGCYEIDLWKWSSKENVYFLSIPLLHSELPGLNVFLNPLWWHQILLQCNSRMILLEVKKAGDKYFLFASSYIFTVNKEEKIELFIKSEIKDHKHMNVIKPTFEDLIIQNACWLPENHILVATSKGILKMGYRDSTFHKLGDSKSEVSSMILSKSGIIIGYKTGCIDIVTLVGHEWNLIETINVDQPIDQLFLSPDYNFLTLTTQNGSIMYRQINQDDGNFCTLFRAELDGDVGVAFLGPLAKLCVTAKKNGFIHIFRRIDGIVISTFQLGEEIASIAASPLCFCIVIGTNVGFLYFIDVTDVQKPKIVRCEKPYDVSIDHLKFDNFGRFLVSSAQNQPINIWNGLPSSGFALVGSKKVKSKVKDFTAFCRKENGDTMLLILCDSASECDDNLLISLKLPPDIGSDPQKYRIDESGILDGDALNFQKRKLDKPCCKIDLHSTLGAIFCSSASRKVHKYPIWTDFSNGIQDDISTIANVNGIRISPDQLWVTLTDLYGCVYLYSSKTFLLAAWSEKHCASENTCKSFLNVSLYSNNLLCLRDNGVMLYYEWTNGSNVLQNVTEWLVYCYYMFDGENKSLQFMEGRKELSLISQVKEMDHNKLFVLQEIYDELEMLTFVLNFNFDKFREEETSLRKYSSAFFEVEFLMKLFLDNRRRLPITLPEKSAAEGKIKKSQKENAIKYISSLPVGFVTEKFSEENIDDDMKRIKTLNLQSGMRNRKTPLFIWSLNKSVKMESSEERLVIVASIIAEICELKTEFNKNFQKLLELKPSVSNLSDENLTRATALTYSIPSKIEKNFRGTSLSDTKYDSDSVDIDFVNTGKRIHPSDKSAVKETKIRSVAFRRKPSQTIQKEFDSDLEILILQKYYCDCNIYRFEVKIHCLLFFAEEEDAFSTWKKKAKKEIKHLGELRGDIDGFIKRLSDLEKGVKETYFLLQAQELNTNYKINKKCLKLDNVKARAFLNKQPALELDDNSQNPFCCSYSAIHKELKSVSRVVFPNPCPNEDYRTMWVYLRNKQIRVLKIGIGMRNLRSLLIEITGAKQTCMDIDFNLETMSNTVQKALGHRKMMISKCSMIFHTLLTTHLEKMSFELLEDPNSKTKFSSLGNLDASKPNIWKDVDLETKRIRWIHQQLEEIGDNFKRLNFLHSKLCSKSKCIRKDYYEEKMKDLVKVLRVEELNFKKLKQVVNEILEENEKSFLTNFSYTNLVHK